MSLNRKTPGFITLTNVVILLVVAFIVWATKNPLALLGLFFLQNMPVFQDGGGHDCDEDGFENEPTAPEDDYAGTKSGFTATL